MRLFKWLTKVIRKRITCCDSASQLQTRFHSFSNISIRLMKKNLSIVPVPPVKIAFFKKGWTHAEIETKYAPHLSPCENLTKNFSVSLTVHLWGGEGCQNLFESVNLAKINVLLEHVTKRNQRLLLKSIRKGIQVHTCLGPFLKIIYPFFIKIATLSDVKNYQFWKREKINCERNLTWLRK